MPQTRSPRRGASTGRGLHKKVAGAPVWVWGVGLVAAILVGLYFRKRAGSSGTAPAGAQPTDATGTVGTTAGADTTGSGTTGTATGTEIGDRNLASQINDFVGQLLQQQLDNLGTSGASGGFDTSSSGDTGAITTDTTPTFPAVDTSSINLPAPNPARMPAFKPSRPGATQPVPGGSFTQVKAQPNKAHGRGPKQRPVKRKPVHPVTSHATHVAPQPRGRTAHPAPKPAAKKGTKRVTPKRTAGQRVGGRPR